jgi:hypothetical protein
MHMARRTRWMSAVEASLKGEEAIRHLHAVGMCQQRMMQLDGSQNSFDLELMMASFRV